MILPPEGADFAVNTISRFCFPYSTNPQKSILASVLGPSAGPAGTISLVEHGAALVILRLLLGGAELQAC